MKYLFLIAIMLSAPVICHAQSLYRYLGNGLEVPDNVSPELQIRFNDRGFENVTSKRLAKSQQRLIDLGAPQSQIKKLLAFPKQDYGQWVESSYHSALSQFTACGGPIAEAAARFDPSTTYVQFEPVPFSDPELPLPNGELLAGEYIPAEHMIKAVAYYKSESDGELAYLPDVLQWEWGNAIAVFVNVTPEPRGTNWPCQ